MMGQSMVKINSSNSREQNWADLADHFKYKVYKRTSDVALLQMRAWFLIIGNLLLYKMVVGGLPKPSSPATIAGYTLLTILLTISILLSVVSTYIGKLPTPLNPDEMILELTEQPKMTREVFASWLAKSYAQAYKEFNIVYNRKYSQQTLATSLFLILCGIVLITKTLYK